MEGPFKRETATGATCGEPDGWLDAAEGNPVTDDDDDMDDDDEGEDEADDELTTLLRDVGKGAQIPLLTTSPDEVDDVMLLDA